MCEEPDYPHPECEEADYPHLECEEADDPHLECKEADDPHLECKEADDPLLWLAVEIIGAKAYRKEILVTGVPTHSRHIQGLLGMLPVRIYSRHI